MKGKTLARVLVRSTSVLSLTAGLLLASQGQAQTAPSDPQQGTPQADTSSQTPPAGEASPTNPQPETTPDDIVVTGVRA